MEKISKSYWGKEIVIYGCTKSDNMFYKRLYKHFSKNGVEVFGLPTTPESDLNFKTYPNLDALPHVPACAYVLCAKEDTEAAVKDLHQHGVTRVLFHSDVFVSDEAKKFCEKNGMEVRVGCPMMLYGPASCYLHAAIRGTLSERKG